MMRSTRITAAVVVCALAGAALAVVADVRAMGNPNVAALQVALRAHGFYLRGWVDGVKGPATTRAVRAFQRRAGIVVDGIAGPQTRRALGRRGRPLLGRRLMRAGQVGWDIAALQFLLAWHGFPSGAFDGVLGPWTERALRRYQRFAGLAVDGVAGRATLHALRSRPPRVPVTLRRPVSAPLGDRFGPRGARFHAGVDFPAPAGTRVRSARRGRVAYARWHSGGWGYLVVVRHGPLRTWYAHLSRIGVRVGQRVRAGSALGRVGATGFATGPHLHFEVRLRGAALDPLPALR